MLKGMLTMIFYMCIEYIKTTMFKSYCTSLYTYHTSESVRKHCVAYNNVFRLLCNEPRNCSDSHMFKSRGLPTCKVLTMNFFLVL